MFQPQPTPYSSFASYGAANAQESDPEQDQQGVSGYNYQQAGLEIASGGPIVFDNPVFNPVPGFGSLPLNVNQNRYTAMNTLPPDDLEAQEALARSYQPDQKVRNSIGI